MSVIGTGVGRLSREAEGEERGDISVVPFFKFPFQQLVIENSSVYDKSLGGYEQKIIPTARRQTCSEELGISNMKMNLNYLNVISLLFPFPLPHACVFQNWICSHFFLPYPREHVLRTSAWVSTILFYHLCAPGFPLIFRITLFAGTKKSWAQCFSDYSFVDIFFRGIFSPIVQGYMSLVLFCLSSRLFWAPWGWAFVWFMFTFAALMPCRAQMRGSRSK